MRSAEFHRACAVLDAQPFIIDYPDGASCGLSGAGGRVLDLLGEASLRPLVGVITHAPHGNERSHPQHIACFDEMQRSCADRAIPFGFFSEIPSPGYEADGESRVNDRVRHAGVSVRWPVLMRPELEAITQSPLHPGRYLRAVRRWRYLRPQFVALTRMFRIDIDLPRKQQLLDLYPSQISGMKEYDTYRRSTEYLYADRRLSDALFPLFLQCPAS